MDIDTARDGAYRRIGCVIRGSQNALVVRIVCVARIQSLTLGPIEYVFAGEVDTQILDEELARDTLGQRISERDVLDVQVRCAGEETVRDVCLIRVVVSKTRNVRTGVLGKYRDSTDVLEEMKSVVNINGLSMSDKERMDVIDRTYNAIRNYRDLVSYYTRKNISVSYLRAKKKKDTDRVMALYGSADERYW